MSLLGAYQILIQIVRENSFPVQQTENAKTANSTACDEPAGLTVDEDQEMEKPAVLVGRANDRQRA